MVCKIFILTGMFMLLFVRMYREPGIYIVRTLQIIAQLCLHSTGFRNTVFPITKILMFVTPPLPEKKSLEIKTTCQPYAYTAMLSCWIHIIVICPYKTYFFSKIFVPIGNVLNRFNTCTCSSIQASSLYLIFSVSFITSVFWYTL